MAEQIAATPRVRCRRRQGGSKRCLVWAGSLAHDRALHHGPGAGLFDQARQVAPQHDLDIVLVLQQGAQRVLDAGSSSSCATSATSA